MKSVRLIFIIEVEYLWFRIICIATCILFYVGYNSRFLDSFALIFCLHMRQILLFMAKKLSFLMDKFLLNYCFCKTKSNFRKVKKQLFNFKISKPTTCATTTSTSTLHRLTKVLRSMSGKRKRRKTETGVSFIFLLN